MRAYHLRDARAPIAEDIRETYGIQPLIAVSLTDRHVVVWVGTTRYRFAGIVEARHYFRAERLAMQCPKLIKFLQEVEA